MKKWKAGGREEYAGDQNVENNGPELYESKETVRKNGEAPGGRSPYNRKMHFAEASDPESEELETEELETEELETEELETEELEKEYLKKEYPKKEYQETKYQETKYPKSQYPKSEYPETEYLESEYPEEDLETEGHKTKARKAMAREASEITNQSSASAKRRRGRRRRNGGVFLPALIGGLTATVLVLCLGIAYYTFSQSSGKDAAEPASGDSPEVMYTRTQLEEQLAEAAAGIRAAVTAEESARILGGIQAGLESGSSVVETLRPFYPEDLVVVSGGRFYFIPVREDLKKHKLLQENLSVAENGRFLYTENGLVTSHMGIDVSQHQGEIDWEQVAADGVEFAIIRVGLRGYGTGKVVPDEQFENNIKGALDNNIRVGVYFFSQAVNTQEAQEEAAFVLERIAPYNIDGPVVYDVEKVSDSSARMNQLSVEERTGVTLAFLQAIEQAGRKPMIYHNMEMAAVLLDLGQLEAYDKWFAYYGSDIYYPYHYKMWQYSDKGTVSGIKGAVDLNISFQPWWEESD